MSTTSISTPPTNIALSPRIRLLSIGLSLVAVMSVTRLWTGFDNLTSSGTISAHYVSPCRSCSPDSQDSGLSVLAFSTLVSKE